MGQLRWHQLWTQLSISSSSYSGEDSTLNHIQPTDQGNTNWTDRFKKKKNPVRNVFVKFKDCLKYKYGRVVNNLTPNPRSEFFFFDKCKNSRNRRIAVAFYLGSWDILKNWGHSPMCIRFFDKVLVLYEVRL